MHIDITIYHVPRERMKTFFAAAQHYFRHRHC